MLTHAKDPTKHRLKHFKKSFKYHTREHINCYPFSVALDLLLVWYIIAHIIIQTLQIIIIKSTIKQALAKQFIYTHIKFFLSWFPRFSQKAFKSSSTVQVRYIDITTPFLGIICIFVAWRSIINNAEVPIMVFFSSIVDQWLRLFADSAFQRGLEE